MEWKFCKNCGGKLGSDSIICTECEMAIGKGGKFCPNCGKQIDQTIGKCIYCAYDTVQQDDKKVSGWLAFFLWYGLGIGGLASIVYAIYTIVSDGDYDILSAIIELLPAILIFIIAIYGIWAFYHKKTNAVSIAKTYIVMSILSGVFAIIVSPLVGDEWSLRQPIRSFIWATIWLTFLAKSENVERLIPKATRTWKLFEKLVLAIYVGILILFTIASAFNNAWHTSITKSIETANKDLPMEVDEGLIMQNVSLNDDCITFNLQHTDVYKYEISDDVLSNLAEFSKYETLYGFYENTESYELVRMCLENGYSVRYLYHDTLSEELYQYTITPEEYYAAIQSDTFHCPDEVLDKYIAIYNAKLPDYYLGDCTIQEIYRQNEMSIVYDLTLPEMSLADLQSLDTTTLRDYISNIWDNNINDPVMRLAIINQMTIGFQFNTFSGLKYQRVDITPAMYNQL